MQATDKTPKFTPKDFYRAVFTDRARADGILGTFSDDNIEIVLLALLWHTVRTYLGKRPSRWRRRWFLWRLTRFFGGKYRDQIAILIDCPYDPDRLTDMPEGKKVDYQLMIMIAVCARNWSDWDDEAVENLVAVIAQHTYLADA